MGHWDWNFVYKVLGWCPKVSLESSLEKPEKVSISKKRLTVFLGIFLIIIVGSYGLWNAYIYSSELKKRGLPITVEINNKEYTYYDNDLPQDIDYKKLMWQMVYFGYNYDDSWYANGSSMETIKLQFNDTQSIKTWFDTVNMMPNIVRNAVNIVLDMNITYIRNRQSRITSLLDKDHPVIFMWGQGGKTGYWLLLYEEEYSYILNLKCLNSERAPIAYPGVIYEIIFRMPYQGNEYTVIFNKMPKT